MDLPSLSRGRSKRDSNDGTTRTKNEELTPGTQELQELGKRLKDRS